MDHRTSIGLDVHARSIKAAAFVPETGEVIEATFPNAAGEVASWACGLPQPTKAVYESGPTGFDLARALASMGVPCVIGATSKMLRPAGDRVKTDKRDALFLARMLAVGNVVEVRIPSAAEEAARDLTRLQEDARADLTRAKLRLTSFLLRRGIVYGEGKTWTGRYRNWIAGLRMDEPGDEFTFQEYLAGVAAAEQRKERVAAEIRRVAAGPEYADRVSRIRCIRGINTYTAFSIVVEVGDFSRFPTARSFMSYLGLVPSESSSGESSSRGEITRTGNGHVRKLLVESAWHHLPRYNPTSPTVLESMSSATDPRAAAKADKANRRLHDKYVRMLSRGKEKCVINSAVARELAGWIWAMENGMY